MEKTVRFLIVLSHLQKWFVMSAILAVSAIITIQFGYLGFITPMIIGAVVWLWMDRPTLSGRQKINIGSWAYVFTFLGFIVGITYVQWNNPYYSNLGISYLLSCIIILAIPYLVGFAIGWAVKVGSDPEEKALNTEGENA